MKSFDWDPEKNLKLRVERGVSFEEVVFHLLAGDIVDIAEHPDQSAYPWQKIFKILIDGYVYLIPFVESEEMIFLKTIIPSRKATKQFLSGEAARNRKDLSEK
ncbi:MAG: BrnT family toxin [Pseudohongiella sp.]|nr:BrnT family toxin [Pseudohongiella sp.]